MIKSSALRKNSLLRLCITQNKWKTFQYSPNQLLLAMSRWSKNLKKSPWPKANLILPLQLGRKRRERWDCLNRNPCRRLAKISRLSRGYLWGWKVGTYCAGWLRWTTRSSRRKMKTRWWEFSTYSWWISLMSRSMEPSSTRLQISSRMSWDSTVSIRYHRAPLTMRATPIRRTRRCLLTGWSLTLTLSSRKFRM